MAIGPLQNLAGLTSDELYSVYVAIAQADHAHRLRALYGNESPPDGHAPLRMISASRFAGRWSLAGRMLGGEEQFLARLSRQAAAYGVDVAAEIARRRQAA